MKVIPPYLPLLIALLFPLFIGLPSWAEDDDEDWEDAEEAEYEPDLSAEDTLIFCRRKLPIAITLMEQVRQEEGEESYQEVLERAQEEANEYHLLLHHDGQQVADLFLKGIRLALEIDQLTHQYFESVDDDKSSTAIKAQLKSKVKEQLEHEKQSILMEIKLMTDDLEGLKAELKEIEESAGERIEEEMHYLLEEDEDDESEDDDDE